jgi:hypothetical protein
MSYTDEVATEEQEPEWVKEGTEEDDGVVEGMDVSAAEQMDRTDVIEPAKGVVMTIKKATLDTYTPKGETAWMKRSLKLQLVVGKAGVDGKGRYANKHFFPRILIAVNRQDHDFSKKWYNPKDGGAWGDYNAFLTALGISTAPAPRNDKALRQSLVGRQIVCDITKDRKQVLDNATGKYVNIDPPEYTNNLLYRGAPKAVAATEERAAE